MDLEYARQCLDNERRSLVHAGEVIEILPEVTRVRAIDGSRHSILWSALTHENADQVIAEQAAHLRMVGGDVEWKVYGYDAPADILSRLAQHGFDVGLCEAVLVLALDDAPEWVDAPSEFGVMRVERLDQVAVFRNVAEAVFHKDQHATADEMAAAIQAGSREHVGYLGYVDDIPASVGRLYTHPNSAFGGLYGGGTLKEHRGQGLYRAMVAARARDARTCGAQFLIVDALPTSRPILERLGFVRLTDTWPCALRPQLPESTGACNGAT